jgi:hypothetical protein
VDYLAGAEIVVDACIAARERFAIDVEARVRASAMKCIVEFALPSQDTENEIAAACWYVEAALRGTTTLETNWFHDGNGALVPPSAVIAVRAADRSEREWRRPRT